jgi:hypothetical protein
LLVFRTEKGPKRSRSGACPALVLTSLVALMACATVDPYPEDWPAVAAERSDCAALIGTFHNGYSRSTTDAMTMKGGLIVMLIGPEESAASAGARPVSRVTIENPSADRLVVKGFNSEGLVREGERRISRTSCTGKGLAINGKFSGTNAENVLGFISASGHLRRAENGDLVGRIRSTFTGIALLIPVSSSTTSWYRFRQIVPQSTPTDSGD